MTFLGKLFVLFNVAASLVMAFVAFALYANSVEWGYDPAKPGQPGGILKQKQEEIRELQSMQPHVENSWREANKNLWAVEGYRITDRDFYAKEFDHLKNKAAGGDPAHTVKIENFKPVRTPGGVPTMEEAKERGDKGGPLLSRAAYDEKLKKAQADNLAVLADLQEKIRRTTEWTEKMLDGAERKADPDAKDKDKDLILEPRGPRGLRALLVLERAKREGVLEEQRQVRPLYINTAVESELILKRLESLQERVKELESYIKKRKMDAELSRR